MWTLSDVRCMYQQETALKSAKAIAVACRNNSLSSLPPALPFWRHVRELSVAPQPCLGLGAQGPANAGAAQADIRRRVRQMDKPCWHGAQNSTELVFG